AHADEQRGDERDDDEEDLPRDTDGRVALVADEVSDQDVVDDALHAADDVREHRRPRDLPYGGLERPLDDGAIVAPSLRGCGESGHSVWRGRGRGFGLR